MLEVFFVSRRNALLKAEEALLSLAVLASGWYACSMLSHAMLTQLPHDAEKKGD